MSDSQTILASIAAVRAENAALKAANDNLVQQMSALILSVKSIETMMTEVHHSSKSTPTTSAAEKPTKIEFKKILSYYVYRAHKNFPADADRLYNSYVGILHQLKPEVVTSFEQNVKAVHAADNSGAVQASDPMNGFYDVRHQYIKKSIELFIQANADFIAAHPLKNSAVGKKNADTPKPNTNTPMDQAILNTIAGNTSTQAIAPGLESSNTFVFATESTVTGADFV